MKLVRILPVAIAAALAMPTVAQYAPANGASATPAASDMEVLRQKVKADKKQVVAANMVLTDAEGQAFWPVYDEYQAELKKINDRVAKAITEYAAEYAKGPISSQGAKKLLDEAISIEEAEAKMRRTLAPKVEKAVGPAKAVRYYQIEGKIRAVVRYELAAAIPLAD